MGVPAFFRWLSRKYPSVIVHCVEQKVNLILEHKAKFNIHVLFYFLGC